MIYHAPTQQSVTSFKKVSHSPHSCPSRPYKWSVMPSHSSLSRPCKWSCHAPTQSCVTPLQMVCHAPTQQSITPLQMVCQAPHTAVWCALTNGLSRPHTAVSTLAVDCAAHGAAPYLAGCYRAMSTWWFTRALARSTATLLMMGFPKHALSSATRTAARSFTLFSDAAIRGSGFQVGVVGALGMYRHYTCPRFTSA